MKRKILLFALLMTMQWIGVRFAYSQTSVFSVNTLRLEARVDFTCDYYFQDYSAEHGFAGKYLNFVIDGNITDKFSYHLRQRINSPNIGFANTFFQGTDWAYLNWHLNDNFFLSAGKQVVAIGGWEYDTAPIDIYYGTEFWNHVVCYEVGASVNYKDDTGKNWLLFQVANSPFIKSSMESIYAYNLMWYGNFGVFKTAYSVNMLEYEPRHFINYISLGNKLQFDGVEMYLDLLNRASFEQERFFGQDFTAIYGIGVDIGKKWIVFAKAGYDFNKAQAHTTPDPFDQWVVPGRKVDFESLGFEYFPLGDRSLRFHLCGSHTSVDGDNKFEGNIGLTWKVDLLHSVLKK